ncbi:hypothetical protein [uncultured Algimonas sp.]|uniref:hypothetical protein n=1 Tax=uncultured Algimonas sp. TaxID=1547920 RepID=UPI00260F0235|nr:hypothetical protein [uncultured Algimonas sp.]
MAARLFGLKFLSTHGSGLGLDKTEPRPTRTGDKPLNINPAPDLLDFEYPPESAFARRDRTDELTPS